MFSLNDLRWDDLISGYGTTYDPRPALQRLQNGDDTARSDLTDELHHQGDVDTASYAVTEE